MTQRLPHENTPKRAKPSMEKNGKRRHAKPSEGTGRPNASPQYQAGQPLSHEAQTSSSDSLTVLANDVDRLIRRHPLTAFAVAFGVGVLLAQLTRR